MTTLKNLFVPLAAGILALSSPCFVACGPSNGANGPERTPVAEKWFTRAKQSYTAGDIDDAKSSIDAALAAAPKDADVRVMKARIALARLEYAEVLRVTEGLQSTDAHQLRGRAYWYQGDLEPAADELEAMLKDPQVRDPWAKEVSKLARRGTGRHPFAIEGGLVAAVDMPRAGPALVVPCELDGERILALVATAMGEVVVDRKESSWVSLRFGDRFEVQDVPAMAQDLSALSRQFGATIKALFGINLLRRLHVTFDRRGDQFVVRKNDPPAPPDASRIPLFFVRGGGMMLRASVTRREDTPSPFLVDTSATYAIALEDSTIRSAGVDPTSFRTEAGAPPNIKIGALPTLRFGGFDLPNVPAVQGVPISEVKTTLDMNVAGIVGSGLLSLFRVTFGDEGRFLWVEPDPALAGPDPNAPQVPRGGPPPGAAPPGAPPGAAPPPPALKGPTK